MDTFYNLLRMVEIMFLRFWTDLLLYYKLKYSWSGLGQARNAALINAVQALMSLRMFL